jgi:hypothetical protein
MTYIASQNLIDIFIENGFLDITKVKYPDHYSFAEKNGYNPSNCKRALGLSEKGKNYILFDYISIKPCYHSSCRGLEIKENLETDELKSIIAFFKLPTTTQKYLKSSYGFSIPLLYQLYSDIKENPKRYSTIKYFQIVNAFENVRL